MIRSTALAAAAACCLAAMPVDVASRAASPKVAKAALSTPAPEAENAPEDQALPIPPVAPRIGEGDQYDRCMDMLADDPAGADALALSWKAGGEAATQCHALAQIELGNPAAGAALLSRVAASSAAPAEARAEVFGEAAQAWTMAGDGAQALEAAAQAIMLSPDDPDLRVTHAIAAVAMHQDGQAIEDLDQVLTADPRRADALSLRATAHRRRGEIAQAAADIALACAEDPDNPDALLERGIIRQREGDRAGARQDWQKVADHAPDTPAADLAQQNLALLEAGPVQ